ncbi:MAG: FAD-binding protein [Sedimentisphaerales bacterium]|nr:FAD-binding protein [Sedimentisphaerales bacterium]
MTNKPENIAAELSRIIRGDIYTDILHKAAYSTDASIYRIVPQCVVMPRDADEISAVIKYARENNIPIVARGGGTGVAGESLTSGIVFDMNRYMNKIIGVENNGEIVTCQPGVVLDELNQHLAQYGRKIGPDPSSASRAVVGGCVANNATGAHSLQYGYMGNYVESIEAVTANGDIVMFRNNFNPEQFPDDPASPIARECLSLLSGKEEIIAKAIPASKRNQSAYSIAGICRDGKIDMARLLAGSEGTLAVFTKITLRTVLLPKAKALLQLGFDSFAKMAQAVPLIVNTGVSACELMDKFLFDMAYEALPEYRDILPRNSEAVLLIEHIGDNIEQVKEKIKITDAAVGKIAKERKTIIDANEQKRLWKSRKDAGPLLYRKRSKKHPAEFMEDISVDHNRLGEYIAGLQDIGKRYNFTMSYYGHAGDGELHVRPFLDLSDPKDHEKMRKIASEVFPLAWSLGGSVSGEHGIGLIRAPFIHKQFGDEYYGLLLKIKNIFDPKNMLNPGKLLNDNPNIMFENLRRSPKILPEKIESDLLFDKNELEMEVEQCYGCGLCLSRDSDLRMCPVFHAIGGELASSRAKASILHFWATGQLDEKEFDSPEFRKFFDLCINCKACMTQCPAGVDISKMMIAVKAKYAKHKGLRTTERILSNNRFMSILGSIFSPVSNFFMHLPIFSFFMEKTIGLDKRRTMPTFLRSSFLKKGRKYLASCKPIEKPIDKVAYFVDTYANYNDHELGFAVINVLRALNIEVILPEQLPAPLPAIVYGDVKRAKKDLSYSAKYLAQAVRDGYKIVCSEPSAALCLKQELRHFVASASSARNHGLEAHDTKLISDNTFELMTYLLNLYKEGKLKGTHGVAGILPANRGRDALDTASNEYVYHLPCHLLAAGEKGASIKLLKELGGIKVTDLNAGCCGLAGTFGMQKKNYQLSSDISAGLKKALEDSRIKNVLTECAACQMQIEHISKTKVTHPIKILAKCFAQK